MTILEKYKECKGIYQKELEGYLDDLAFYGYTEKNDNIDVLKAQFSFFQEQLSKLEKLANNCHNRGKKIVDVSKITVYEAAAVFPQLLNNGYESFKVRVENNEDKQYLLLEPSYINEEDDLQIRIDEGTIILSVRKNNPSNYFYLYNFMDSVNLESVIELNPSSENSKEVLDIQKFIEYGLINRESKNVSWINLLLQFHIDEGLEYFGEEEKKIETNYQDDINEHEKLAMKHSIQRRQRILKSKERRRMMAKRKQKNI